MLILVSKTYKSILLSSHVGVDVEVPREVIFKIQRRPVSVKATVEDLMYIWVYFWDQISWISLGPTPAEDYRKFIILIVQPSYAPLEADPDVPPPALSVVERLTVREGRALRVCDEHTLDSGHGFGE